MSKEHISYKKPDRFWSKGFFRNLCFLTVAFVSVNSHSSAQTVRAFGAQNGVNISNVKYITQDTDGFVYIGTDTGLYRSSGGDFTCVTDQDGKRFPHISFLTAGSQNKLLFVSDGKLIIRDQKHYYVVQTGVDSNYRSYKFKDGFLSVDSNSNFYNIYSQYRGHWESHAQKNISLPSGNLSKFIVVNDSVWIVDSSSLYRYRDGNLKYFREREGISDKYIYDITEDGKGNTYVFGDKSVTEINSSDGITLNALPDHKCNGSSQCKVIALENDCIFIDQDRIWIFREGKGWRRAWLPTVRDYNIVSAFSDREKGIWLVLANQGLVRISGLTAWDSYGEERGLPSGQVFSVQKDQYDTLWIASSEGLYHVKYRSEEKTDIQTISHYNIDIKTLLRAGDGSIWGAGNSSYLVHVNPTTGSINKLVSAFPLTGVMKLDSAGHLWVGSQHGIIRIEEPLKPLWRVPAAVSLADRKINDIEFDQFGRLLILTDNVLFQQKSGQEYFEPRLDITNLNIGAGQTLTTTMSNEIWLAGTTGGIRRVSLPDDSNASVSLLDEAAPEFNVITSLMRDSRGWIWVGTPSGLEMYGPEGWRYFGFESGMKSSAVAPHSLTEDEDNTIWVGNNDGLSHLIDPDSTQQIPDLNTVILSAYVGSVDISERNKIWPDYNRDFRIGFVAPLFEGRDGIKYRTKFDGFDSDWRLTSSQILTYSDLKSRDVNFSLQAIDKRNSRKSGIISFHSSSVGGKRKATKIFFIILPFVVCIFSGFYLFGIIKKKRKKNLDRAVHDRTRVISEVHEQLKYQSRVDSLTGLLNRKTVLDELSYIIDSQSGKENIAVALVDIDHFKKINDTFGHQAGDFVLETYGARLREKSAPNIISGRYGGEELIIVFSSFRDKEDLKKYLDSLHSYLADKCQFEDNEIIATCTIGVSIMGPGDTMSSLIGRADRVLYKGKRSGRNKVVFAI